MKNFRNISLMLALACSSVWAQDYPDRSRPLKIVVPFGAGSSVDLLTRSIARSLDEKGVPTIVENKPGASGIIAMREVKNAAPDGYTMTMANSSIQVFNVYMLPNVPYDPVKDYTPITGIADYPLVLNASTTLPFKTVNELIDAAKKNPGRYRFGSATTTTLLAMELFKKQAGIELLSVPYKAMSQATLALASGEVDLVVNDAITAKTFYDTGRVRPLAASSANRVKILPDVPTLKEAGLDYEMTVWLGAYFPANTPKVIVEKMRTLLAASMRSPAVVEAMDRASYEPMLISGTELTALQRSDAKKWGKLIRDAGLAPR